MRAKTTAEKTDVANPVVTAVVDPAALTPEEKAAVIDAVKVANPNLPDDATITVADNGDVTIAYVDGSEDTIEAKDSVRAKTTADLPKQPDAKAGKVLSKTGSQVWGFLVAACALLCSGTVVLVARKKSAS